MQKTTRTLVLVALGSALALTLGCTHQPRHEEYAANTGCTQQNYAHCLPYGETLFNEGLRAKSPAQSEQFYNQAIQTWQNGCQWGDAPSCFLLGRVYETGFYKEKAAKTAEAYYQQACNAGIVASCATLGDMYTKTKQYTLAKNVYKEMCDKYGDQKACTVYESHQKGKRTACYY